MSKVANILLACLFALAFVSAPLVALARTKDKPNSGFCKSGKHVQRHEGLQRKRRHQVSHGAKRLIEFRRDRRGLAVFLFTMRLSAIDAVDGSSTGT